MTKEQEAITHYKEYGMCKCKHCKLCSSSHWCEANNRTVKIFFDKRVSLYFERWHRCEQFKHKYAKLKWLVEVE